MRMQIKPNMHKLAIAANTATTNNANMSSAAIMISNKIATTMMITCRISREGRVSRGSRANRCSTVCTDSAADIRSSTADRNMTISIINTNTVATTIAKHETTSTGT